MKSTKEKRITVRLTPEQYESKQRRQEKEKKIALGHRPDDHEETFTYSMPTM